LSLPLQMGKCHTHQQIRGKWLFQLSFTIPQFSQRLGTERRAGTPKTPQVKASGSSKRSWSLHGARDDKPPPNSTPHPESCNFPAVILPRRKLFPLFLETGSCYVAHADLDLLGSSNPPASASQAAGTTGMYPCAGLPNFLST
jgi:hypothetical protein